MNGAAPKARTGDAPAFPDVLVVGELNVDVIVSGLPGPPRFGQVEEVVDDVRLVLGSSSAITACGLARLGEDVGLVTVVGDDTFGRAALGALGAAGVDTTRCAVDPEVPTGATVVLGWEGNRALLTALGTIGRTTAAHVGRLPARPGPGAPRHLHVGSGFLQTALLGDLPDVLEAARAAGATVSLDPNWDPAQRWTALDHVLPHVDLLLVNEVEATAMGGTDDPRAAAGRLLARMSAGPRPARPADRPALAGPFVVVKHGGSGASVLGHGLDLRTPVPAGLDVAVRDTTGAGDSFTAGYVHAALAGAAPHVALRAGVLAGTLSTRGIGGTASQADRGELHALLDPDPAGPLRPSAQRPRHDMPSTPPPAHPHLPPAGGATAAEVASQPDAWRRAGDPGLVATVPLPAPGARVAVIGCGTSYYVGRAYAQLREAAGLGETDAFVASTLPPGRRYDHVLALSRSGTTSDVVTALSALAARPAPVPTLSVVGVPHSPVATGSDASVALDFADERSVVQTRFATSALLLLRASLGHDVEALAAQAERALAEPLPVAVDDHDHVVFLASGWAESLAQEAALKVLEGTGRRAEAYLAGEYLHGPVSTCGPRTLVWALDPVPAAVAAGIALTGGRLHTGDLDPMAELVRVHRYMLAVADLVGRDPDRPPYLSRSVVDAPPVHAALNGTLAAADGRG